MLISAGPRRYGCLNSLYRISSKVAGSDTVYFDQNVKFHISDQNSTYFMNKI